jgi:hypothetical protein
MSMKFLFSIFISAAFVALAATNVARAVSVQTLNNPVPNGFIQIDGGLNDWLSVPWYNADNVGDGSTGTGRPLNIDILQGAIAHDDNNIYVLWRNTGDNMIDGFSNWIFFDLDRDSATGARNANAAVSPIAIGYEFNLGGTIGWNAFNTTGGFVAAAAGKTTGTGDTNGSGGADFLEWSISRSASQPNGLTFNAIGGSDFYVTYAVEDSVGDYYPNNVQTDWFTYNTTGQYNVGVPGDANGVGGVTIDDYLLIQAHSFTRVLLGQSGDVNDDGFVDFADFHEWKQNYPGGPAAAEAAIAALNVPEPNAIVLCGLVVGAFLLGRRRKGC